MKIFCTDLDNTLIYSYKHDIGNKKRNVEIYQGREISFITEKTYEMLQKIKKDYLIIPTSTRTIEQYERIDLGIGKFPYALVCNGGILLVDGKQEEEWYQESRKLVKESRQELEKAMLGLEQDFRRKFELRFIEELFVFTKCISPEEVIQELKLQLNTDVVDVFNNGEKVYVVPKNLSKGRAIKRLREKLKPQYLIAAGDSEFDITMVEEADFGLVPNGFRKMFPIKKERNVIEMEGGRPFSESLLEKVLALKMDFRK